MEEFKKYISEMFTKLVDLLGVLTLSSHLDRTDIEYQAIEIDVTTDNQLIEITDTTRQEFKKILGVFFVQNGTTTDYLSTIYLNINQRDVICRDKVHFFLHTKTENLSIKETAFLTDIDVANSAIRISYQDAKPTFAAYKAYVYLIGQK